MGFGAIVLIGVCIGNSALIGAGSVVTDDIIDEDIAVEIPARVVKMRKDISWGKLKNWYNLINIDPVRKAKLSGVCDYLLRRLINCL